MQINKRNKLSLSRHKTSSGDSRSDFSSILDESPWERFIDKAKPLMKVLVVLVVIGSAIYGGVMLFGGKNSKPSEYVGQVQSHASDKLKLSECISNVITASPSPETSDPEFYKKLIGRYDEQLSCHDKYPNTDLADRTELERLRQGAIDSSGAYKDTYLAGGGSYEYKSSSSNTNPTTGCSYTLSESEYIKCTDSYNAKNGTSVSRTPPATTTPSTGVETPSSNPSPTTPSTTPSTPTAGVDYAALNECLDKTKSYPNEASKARAIQYCYQTWGGQ
jgi:hypothetical protein